MMTVDRHSQGAHLEGVDLRDADLRGVDLSGADLRNADLRGVRTGRSARTNAVVVIAAMLSAIVFGVLTGMAGRWLHRLATSPALFDRQFAALIAAMLIVSLAAIAWRGLDFAIRYVITALFAFTATAGVLTVATGVGTGHGALAVLTFATVVVVLVFLGSLARAVGGSARTLSFVIVAISGALAGGLTGGGPLAIAVAIVSVLSARASLGGDLRAPLLNRLSRALSSAGGTKFRDANLAGAQLARARLACSDFRGATLDDGQFDAALIRSCRFDAGKPRRLHPSPPTLH